MTRKILMLLSLALGLLGAPASAQTSAPSGFKVIVNPKNPLTSISRAELAKIFLRKTSLWSGGQRTAPVDQPSTVASRESFSRTVHGKSARAVKIYWNQQIFSGKGVPPVEMAGDAKIVAYVLSTPGAVAYVAADADVTGAKVVAIVN